MRPIINVQVMIKACSHDAISKTQSLSNSLICKSSLWSQHNSTKESYDTNHILCGAFKGLVPCSTSSFIIISRSFRCIYNIYFAIHIYIFMFFDEQSWNPTVWKYHNQNCTSWWKPGSRCPQVLCTQISYVYECWSIWIPWMDGHSACLFLCKLWSIVSFSPWRQQMCGLFLLLSQVNITDIWKIKLVLDLLLETFASSWFLGALTSPIKS